MRRVLRFEKIEKLSGWEHRNTSCELEQMLVAGDERCAFILRQKRNRWLEPGTLRTRTSQPGKSARFDFRDGGSRVNVYFESKGRSKATVHVEHERLSDEGAVEEMRAFWKERLPELARRAAQ